MPTASDSQAVANDETNFFAYAAWIIAMVATLSSLFFGEVMQLPPCTLCWYQRICLFPLTVSIAAGIVLRDKNMIYYTLPLAGLGLAIAVYHNLLYYGVIPESLSPCLQGVSCSTRQIEWLGFITIPMLSLSAFVLLLICLLIHERSLRRSRL